MTSGTWCCSIHRLPLWWCIGTIMWRIDYSHYTDVIMSEIASQITSLTIVYSTVYSGTNQRKHQSSASLAFVRGIHGEFPAQRPETRKMFPVDDVIMSVLFNQYEVTALLNSLNKKCVAVITARWQKADKLFFLPYLYSTFTKLLKL